MKHRYTFVILCQITLCKEINYVKRKYVLITSTILLQIGEKMVTPLFLLLLLLLYKFSFNMHRSAYTG